MTDINWNGRIALELMKQIKKPVTATDIVQRLELESGQKLSSFRSTIIQTLEGGVRYGYLNKKGRRYVLKVTKPDHIEKRVLKLGLEYMNAGTQYNIYEQAKIKQQCDRTMSQKPIPVGSDEKKKIQLKGTKRARGYSIPTIKSGSIWKKWRH